MLGHLDDAQPTLERANTIHERTVRPAVGQLWATRVDLAAVRRKRGHPQQALELLEPTLAQVTNAYGATHHAVGWLLAGIGDVHTVRATRRARSIITGVPSRS